RGVDFDNRTILDPDGMLQLERLPRSLTVIGGGVIGVEYASMAVALGIHVTLVDGWRRVLDSVDVELVEALLYRLAGHGLELRLGSTAVAVRRTNVGAVTHLDDGTALQSDAALYTAGRRGATAGLNLSAAGLEANSWGRVEVDANLRTRQPH